MTKLAKHIGRIGKVIAGGIVGFAIAKMATRKLRESTENAPQPDDDTYSGEDAVAVSYPTMFGKANIYTIRQDSHTGANDEFAWIRVLELDGAYQAATFIDDSRVYDLVFDYYKMYDHLFEANLPVQTVELPGAPTKASNAGAALARECKQEDIDWPADHQQPQPTAVPNDETNAASAASSTARPINLLMLGGGGYAYPKHIVAHHPEARIDVVEVDPDITLLAERYFFLDRLIEEFETEKTRRLGLICDDGLHYLETCEARYDAILNDTFAGKTPVETLLTRDALALAKTHLAPGGLYMANVISALEGPAAAPLQKIIDALFEVFARVYVVPCGKYPATETDNHLVIATDGSYVFENAIPQFRAVHV